MRRVSLSSDALHHCLTASPPHCLTASLPHRLTASPPHSLALAWPRLEQLHGVARWIVDNDLGAAGAGHDVARAEGNPRCTQPRNFRGEIVHLEMDGIQADGYLV